MPLDKQIPKRIEYSLDSGRPTVSPSSVGIIWKPNPIFQFFFLYQNQKEHNYIQSHTIRGFRRCPNSINKFSPPYNIFTDSLMGVGSWPASVSRNKKRLSHNHRDTSEGHIGELINFVCLRKRYQNVAMRKFVQLVSNTENWMPIHS